MKMAEHENSSISLFAPVSFQTAGLVDLPATENEVVAIQSLFDDFGITTNSYLKDDATKQAVLSDEISQSRFIHFATHGVVDEENPASSVP